MGVATIQSRCQIAPSEATAVRSMINLIISVLNDPDPNSFVRKLSISNQAWKRTNLLQAHLQASFAEKACKRLLFFPCAPHTEENYSTPLIDTAFNALFHCRV